MVADTKYKLDGAPTPGDLYQMLAYCRILQVPRGLLITVGEAGRRSFRVKDNSTTIDVFPVPLSHSIGEIEGTLVALARHVLDCFATGSTGA